MPGTGSSRDTITTVPGSSCRPVRTCSRGASRWIPRRTSGLRILHARRQPRAQPIVGSCHGPPASRLRRSHRAGPRAGGSGGSLGACRSRRPAVRSARLFGGSPARAIDRSGRPGPRGSSVVRRAEPRRPSVRRSSRASGGRDRDRPRRGGEGPRRRGAGRSHVPHGARQPGGEPLGQLRSVLGEHIELRCGAPRGRASRDAAVPLRPERRRTLRRAVVLWGPGLRSGLPTLPRVGQSGSARCRPASCARVTVPYRKSWAHFRRGGISRPPSDGTSRSG